jgi:anti-sigma regulatory factor (Ser/Thr protein kinase)
MNWGSPEFVLLLVAVSTAGWVFNNWIRARHGYALEDEWGGKTAPVDSAANAALQAENKQLRAELDAMRERMANVERIVTDTGFDTALQIESLRNRDTNARQGAAHGH